VGADPTIEGIREVLDESLDEIRLGVAELTVEQLNARPTGGETNSIAVIVAHALGSTLSWLSLATGAPLPPRDRDAEFVTVAGEDFAAWTEDAIGRCLAVLDGATWDPGMIRTPDWSPHLAEEPRTTAYAAAHALAHLGEHVGHLHMTRELLGPTG
jgi:uncharacterized damage-inducible protein DinB